MTNFDLQEDVDDVDDAGDQEKPKFKKVRIMPPVVLQGLSNELSRARIRSELKALYRGGVMKR